ncbi:MULTISPECIES: MarR family winged helix-turn-helix transcriptional regulator [Actinomadura]|uniref:MarR family transcriptional regulator n=1 Tax=Actinomadura litoris TaxID=2678616 RepID=A0A7K1KU91_9ACTN|nr:MULTISPECIES: MarR family transcriptional regulator [Actinomadura]MBT2207442.1 MarR family transcriptional regulator [Actinomadura sp. NEAU-AAG7]MUN35749.1 MarR family transcriptional regulator [Actinomadura litoris]
MSRPAGDREVAGALLELACVIEGIRGVVSRELGLTPQQAQLLTLVDPGELTHGELAHRLNCDKTNVTGLVDRLERRGLVRRRPDPDDRRVTRVSLDDQGVELVARFRTAVTAAIAGRLTSGPSARHDELLTLARATTGALRA